MSTSLLQNNVIIIFKAEQQWTQHEKNEIYKGHVSSIFLKVMRPDFCKMRSGRKYSKCSLCKLTLLVSEDEPETQST